MGRGHTQHEDHAQATEPAPNNRYFLLGGSDQATLAVHAQLEYHHEPGVQLKT